MKAILTYHSIDDSGSPISVPSDVFTSHVRWLAASGVAVVSVDELAQLPHHVNAVALTFDDGFRNFAEHAWPLLKEHAFPVTMFVVTEHAGGTNSWSSPRFPAAPALPLMSWEELGRLAADGLTIGSHTRHHHDLRTLPEAQVLAEIAGASERIAREIGATPTTFAYPYGAYNHRVADAVRATHEFACTTELRFMGKHEDSAQLPRLDAYYFRRPGVLDGLGRGSFERYIWMRASGRKLRRALELTGVRA